VEVKKKQATTKKTEGRQSNIPGAHHASPFEPAGNDHQNTERDTSFKEAQELAGVCPILLA
jgi:hypothetical protein